MSSAMNFSNTAAVIGIGSGAQIGELRFHLGVGQSRR